MENESLYNLWFSGKQLIIFDLDGTLYNEWDYLSPAYQEIGRNVENKFGISHSRIYQFLESEFHAYGRRGLFDKLINAFDLPSDYLTEALYILRNIKITAKIICFDQITKCLEWLINRNKQIFIVTNGNIIQQKNKIGNIEFGSKLNHISVIYADEIKPKPDPEVFIYLKDKLKINSAEVVMIGDSSTDELFAGAAGIDFIHIDQIIHIS